ncbi:copper chaperone PCu(A)C [Nitrincola nitratireducens]|uniref:Copper chaperone PCu(A)C n=1 Tax=Nitrincola nitratireducens TaxID=1229521 RepID=W9URL0_9GAMM|nr:copper chaperone PCu(A)C [Nitrincola nitratireducens]EXJ09838.1 hypothetical protein D791_03166 [Nitrincola nitratireducens]
MKKLLIACSLFTSASLFACEDLHIVDPYARAMPPGQPNSAAFMTLSNHGKTDVAIVSAQSSVSEVTELHTHTEVDGVMQMRQIAQIDIPAETDVHLEPGGLHVMLIGLKTTLTEGEEIDLTLNLSDGTEKQLSIPVRQVMPMRSAEHGHGHSHSHKHSH